jgi:hypothetical protein
MSKRSANCPHDTWDILPGGSVKCRVCGELVDQDDVDDWVGSDPLIDGESTKISPLTFRLGDAHFTNGGHNG